MIVLPDGRVLTFTDPAWNNGLQTPAAGYVVDIPSGGIPGAAVHVPNGMDDIFCAGMTFFADGRLIVAGGTNTTGVSGPGAPAFNIFDWRTTAWSQGTSMEYSRWYPTTTTLADGEVVVLSGSEDTNYSNASTPEVTTDAGLGPWRELTTAVLPLTLYPRSFLAPNGKVFVATGGSPPGNNQVTRYLDTSGTGSWSTVGSSLFGNRFNGTAAMYDDGKILIAGGTPNFAVAPATNTAEVINLNDASPAWRYTNPMAFPRQYPNSTLLPDGKVLVTGGTSNPDNVLDSGAALAAEMWDPVTEQWSTMASMNHARLYHSTAVLLPDGRVLSGGTTATGVTGNDVDIYSPPYLFKGARPTIASVPSSVGYGQTFTVQTPDAASIAQVNWIRLSAVTHAFNENQRINRLAFNTGSGALSVTAPTDPNLSPPGHYILFILNGQGVPSVGSVVQIISSATPSPSPSGTPTSSPVPTSTPTPNPTPTVAPTPTATLNPTGTPSPTPAPGAAPSFRSAAWSGPVSGSTCPASAPADALPGEVEIAMISTLSYTIGTDVTVAPPAGWTPIPGASCSSSGRDQQQAFFYHVVGASEPASYVWNVTGNPWPTACNAIIAAYANVDTANPVDASACLYAAGGTTVTAPSITTQFQNDRLLWVGTGFEWSFDAASWTTPAGFTQRAVGQSFGNLGSNFADRVLTSAGATGSASALISPADPNIGSFIALTGQWLPSPTPTSTATPASFAVVAGLQGSTIGGASVTTNTWTPQSGNMIAVFVDLTSTTINVANVTDSLGNIYQLASARTGTNGRVEMWFSTGIKGGGSNSITVNLTGSTKAVVRGEEFSGVPATATLLNAAGNASVSAGSNATTSGVTVSGPSFLLADIGWDSSAEASLTQGGFARIGQLSNGDSSATVSYFFAKASSVGTYGTGATLSTGSNWQGVGAAFAVLGSPGATPTPTPTQVPTATPSPAPVTLRSASTSAPAVAASGITIGVPTGTRDGDVMVAFIAARANSNHISGPPGWALLREDTFGSSPYVTVATYTRTASSEPATYTWTLNSSVNVAGSIVSYFNCGGVDASSGQGNAAGTFSSTAPGVTVPGGDIHDLLLEMFSPSAGVGFTAVTLPAGTTQRLNFGTSGISEAMGEERLSAGGATGSRTAVLSINDRSSVAQLIALRPNP
jgi:hypothetical protein